MRMTERALISCLYGCRGGTDHPWASASVIAPLIIGILTFAAFVFVELKVALREFSWKAKK